MKFNHTAHKELWNWLADNPSKGKFEWPGWKENGGKYKPQENNCFACEYASTALDDSTNDFKTCPLIWKGHPGKHRDGSCQFDCEHGGEYGLWEYAKTLEEKPNFARQIANLPVREGVECK